MPFADAVLAAAPREVSARLSEDPDARELLEGLCARAKSAWPELELSEPVFARFIAERLQPATLEKGVDALHAEDLALVSAVLQGDARAMKLFEARMLRPAARASYPDDADELAQRLRQKLLLGTHPRLGEFAGRGPLLAWLRMVARREAIDLQRSSGRARETSSEPEEPLADLFASDPELNAIRERAKASLQEAIRAALSELELKDRRLLRMHYLDGLAHGQIGQALGAPRSTIAHWLVQARARLLERTREKLKAVLKISERELDSLIGLVRSHLDLSFSVLKDD